MGGIYLEGDCSSDFHVFNVDGIALEKAHTLALSCVPEGATVIVNINGNINDFKPLSNISLSDFIPNRTKTVFNLYEATSLSISGVAIEGLLLAPFADISFQRDCLHHAGFQCDISCEFQPTAEATRSCDCG